MFIWDLFGNHWSVIRYEGPYFCSVSIVFTIMMIELLGKNIYTKNINKRNIYRLRSKIKYHKIYSFNYLS